MTRHGALAALVGGLGLVAGIIASSVAAAVVLVTLGLPAAGRADDGGRAVVATSSPRPQELVIALQLGDPVLQAGVVRDGEVVLARGLEVDVAREVARRLRFRKLRFVDLASPARATAAAAPDWHLAVATARPTRRAAGAGAVLSDVYVATGQAVLQRRGQPGVRRLAELRRLRLCATRGSSGAGVVGAVVRPSHAPRLATSDERLVQLVRTGACDAALVDVMEVGRLVAGRRALLGPIVARVDRGEGLALAIASDGGLDVRSVDRELRRLRADGTLARLSRGWLRIDPNGLRALR